jgi:hypothetical protein
MEHGHGRRVDERLLKSAACVWADAPPPTVVNAIRASGPPTSNQPKRNRFEQPRGGKDGESRPPFHSLAHIARDPISDRRSRTHKTELRALNFERSNRRHTSNDFHTSKKKLFGARGKRGCLDAHANSLCRFTGRGRGSRSTRGTADVSGCERGRPAHTLESARVGKAVEPGTFRKFLVVRCTVNSTWNCQQETLVAYQKIVAQLVFAPPPRVPTSDKARADGSVRRSGEFAEERNQETTRSFPDLSIAWLFCLQF